MKPLRFVLIPILLLFVFGKWLISPHFPDHSASYLKQLEKKMAPADHFFLQRSWPDISFDYRAYEHALSVARRRQTHTLSTRGDNSWTTQGPGNIGGRINTIATHPTNTNIIYVGSAAGGLFKTTDGGQNWLPIFDDFSYLAIGDITISSHNSNVIYVGTGDPNISGYPAIGNGIYKSEDGGASWTHLGLADQSIVSSIIVDPADSLTIFAGTMGIPFERDNKRGLYKSTDGGQSWTQVLFVSDQAGIIDMVKDPIYPGILYAASWDRIRNNQESTISGMGGGIWKTTDNGDNWQQISGGGFPSGPLGRVGLAVDGGTAFRLYAIVVGTDANVEGVYLSVDAGNNWSNITGNLAPGALGGFGWYFGKIRVNPSNPNEIYVLGVQLHKSNDGGVNWFEADPPWWQYQVHADKHDLVFGPGGGIYLATDGGLYRSVDNGANWTDAEDIPNTQFYRVAVNPHQPGTYYGGAQDNGSTGGNQSNINSWPRIYGGDGFQMAFDPRSPDTFYVETQYGGLAYTADAGNSFAPHQNGINSADRTNWDTPFMLSDSDPATQYTATYRVYKNITGPGGQWDSISPDLTDGLIFHPRFHTVSTVDESPKNEQILYAGTTDGNVWITTNGGINWIDITGSLPDRYVTSIKASTTDSSIAFVTHSGYKYNDFFPHIHKTNNYGVTWEDISGDLPPLAINDVYLYPGDDDIIFVATDGGVYTTINGGQNWYRLGNNMPMIPVYDLEIETTSMTLVAGTFARSIMTFDLNDLFIFSQPQVNISGTKTPCAGDTVVLTAPDGFASYSWNTGDTSRQLIVTTSGDYQVAVSNEYGYISQPSDSFSINFQPLPTANFAFDTTGLSVQFTDSSANTASWYWDFGDGNSSQDQSPLHTFPNSGTYPVKLIVENECGKDSLTMDVSILISSLNPLKGVSKLDIFPIPAKNRLFIQGKADRILDLDVQLIDMQGKLIKSISVNQKGHFSAELNVAALGRGLYFIRIADGDKQFTKKIILR